MAKVLFSLLFVTPLCHLSSLGQSTITTSGVHAMVCVKKDRVLLRWSPTTPIAWQYALKNGYVVERVTIVKNGKLVPPKLAQKITIPFKVAPQADFTKAFLATKDSMIAIGLQACYGQSFIAKSKNPNIYEAIEKTKEVEQRFVFSMYSSGLSRNTAQLMGVFHVDSQLVKGEKYLYKIFIPLNKSDEKLDTGAVFADTDQPTAYPRNRSLHGDFNKKQVKLSWDYALHQGSYLAYIVERSEDGVNFVSITPRPYAPLTENPNNSTMYYVDSLPSMNKRYYFRVFGKTYFGENGPYSNIVYGTGLEGLPEAPKIVALTEPEGQKVKVEWSLPSEYNRLVRDFQVNIAPAPGKKGQKTIVKDLSQRNIILPAPYPSNYISISAIGTDSITYSSPQSLFQLKDVTPPASPTKYKAKIDTNGVLTITWAKNKELDIYGYRVYYANAKHEELVQPRPLIFKDTIYTDTLPLDNLTNKIYFKLCALDYHYNSSPLTPFIEVNKPDRMAPSIPVFYSVVSTASGVHLKWNNSNSLDVVAHVLYRKEESAVDWIQIARFDTVTCPRGKSCQFMDKAAGKNEDKGSLRPSNKTWYHYAVRALDESGNFSPYSEIVRAKPLDLKIAEGLSDVKATVDREAKAIVLTWKHPDAIRVMVYRKKGEESLYHYHTVEKKESFTDVSPQINTSYTYRLRAVLADGSLTPFSETIQVNY